MEREIHINSNKIILRVTSNYFNHPGFNVGQKYLVPIRDSFIIILGLFEVVL